VLLETNGNGATQARYTLTPDDLGLLVAQRRNGATAFYHADALGSAVGLSAADQSLTDSYRYFAFGDTLTTTGDTVNSFRFVGQLGYYHEPALALQYLRARWYRPKTGRFTSSDPLRLPSLPRYGYAANSGPNWADPEGLMEFRAKYAPDPWCGILPESPWNSLRAEARDWALWMRARAAVASGLAGLLLCFPPVNITLPQASKYLRIYLDNTTKDAVHEIDFPLMVHECPNLQPKVLGVFGDVVAFVRDWLAKHGENALPIEFGSTKCEVWSVEWHQNLDYFLAVHNFSVYGTGKVLAGGKCPKVVFTLHMVDRYDFDKSNPLFYPFWRLHATGWAREYLIKGDYELLQGK